VTQILAVHSNCSIKLNYQVSNTSLPWRIHGKVVNCQLRPFKDEKVKNVMKVKLSAKDCALPTYQFFGIDNW
jgi:hypothetical protein